MAIFKFFRLSLAPFFAEPSQCLCVGECIFRAVCACFGTPENLSSHLPAAAAAAAAVSVCLSLFILFFLKILVSCRFCFFPSNFFFWMTMISFGGRYVQ
ncbi:hypothetical protein DAPPUDRAFT_301018 [Daphnia pulex]|uniref:Secreted protein n=1 Tax=Daphnia pulex TaxID=6669 RepID=E9HGD3_DAPPU|nr:hypothetical protein DAPPUDRAFT_301018 [Daphnia pulex]|eukprot:EFX69206.1 hypothetical protein DAPPUDRAFT_301018 [Daphnia pulex]